MIKWKEKESLPFDLLSDTSHEVLEAWGVWSEKSMYGKKFWGVVRSHWIIDEDGVIADAQIKISPQASIDTALEFLSK